MKNMKSRKISGRLLYRAASPVLNLMRLGLRVAPLAVRSILLMPFTWSDSLFGVAARNLLLTSAFRSSGSNVYFARYVIIKNASNISVGNNISIHEFCYIDGLGGVSIGDNVSIAHSSSILSTNHQWEDSSIPIKYNPVSSAAVTISDDVWIGCGVRILAGVTIGPRSVIAAGAVVSKSVDGNALYAGVPARKIRDL